VADYNLGTARGRIVIETDSTAMKKVKSDIDDIGDAAEKSAKKSAGLKDALGTIANSSLIGGAALAGGLGLAAKAAGTFEFQLSAIKAVSGATADQMQSVSDKALQLGKDTAYGSSQAASAMQELAKAGIPIKSIVDGAADAVVALAAAGEVELTEAATIVAASMNQFKLSAEDTARVADIFAGAANASATGVNEVGLAMSYVGPIANAAGVSIEETAAAVALLANNGIDSQKAGTALRAVLTRLQPVGETATTAMRELGLVTEDGANAFYNADGTIKSMSDIVGILNTSMSGLTEQQKLAYGQAIFGTEALSAISAIAGTTSEEFDTLSAAITGTDAADIATERLNNMDGQLTILKGSIETTAIILGTSLLPMITDVVKQGTEWVNKFASMDSATQASIVKVVAIVAAALLLLGITIKVTMAVVKLVQAIWTVVTAIGRAIVASAKWVAQMAVKSVAMAKDLAQTAALRAMYAKDMVVAMAKATVAWVAQTATTVASTVALVAHQVAMYAVRGAMLVATAAQWLFNAALTANPIGLIIAAVALLVAGLVWFFTQTELGQQIFSAAWAGIQAAVAAVVDWFQNTMLPIITAVWDSITAVVSGVVDWFQTYVLPAFQAIGEFISAVFGLLWDVIQLVWIGIMAAVQFVVDWFNNTVVPAFKAFSDKVASIFTAIWDFLSDIWNTIYDFISGIVKKVVAFVVDYYTTLWNTIKTIFTGIYNFIKGIWDSVYSTVSGIVTTVVNFIKTKFTEARDKVTEIFNAVKDKVVEVFNGIKDAVEEKLGEVYVFVDGIKTKVLGAFTNAKNWLFDIGKDILGGLKRGLENALSGVTDFFGGLTDMIPDIKGPAERDRKLLTENGQLIMQSLVDGFENGRGDVTKALESLTDMIPAKVNADISASFSGSAIQAALTAGAARNNQFTYNAAPGTGQLDGEQALLDSMRRARTLVPGWGG